ncbi:hypothetical protein [Streptomyces sp. NPDC093991]|uniref:hypothetical protein n=1 Tax=unclassified Streptomyces TaxID=2593676 RepID=UPI00343A2F30
MPHRESGRGRPRPPSCTNRLKSGTSVPLGFDGLAVYASRATGRDLTGFFAGTWHYPVTASGLSRIAALGLDAPSVDASTYRQ